MKARRLTLLAALATALGIAHVNSAAAETTTFGFTGAEQAYTVPAGVRSIHVVAIGAAGGKGTSSIVSGGGAGGSGVRVEADLTVEPGQVLFVEVGGVGAKVPSPGPGRAGSTEAGPPRPPCPAAGVAEARTSGPVRARRSAASGRRTPSARGCSSRAVAEAAEPWGTATSSPEARAGARARAGLSVRVAAAKGAPRREAAARAVRRLPAEPAEREAIPSPPRAALVNSASAEA
jgi:hypothetical protein